ncbi:MAG: IclR family transcriptional regulator C-terminal domain-containing protein [Succinatimonas hippei]|nr:IclR family transcriptional regulator C-terminal domain-containing protein [Succinatimonas hippei]
MYKNNNHGPVKAPALERGIIILDIVRKLGSCSVRKIVAESGLPRSSVYVLVDTLTSFEMIRQKENGEYQLWTRAFQLGKAATSSLSPDNHLSSCLQYLAETPGAVAACYAIRNNDAAFYFMVRTRSGTISPFESEGDHIEIGSGAIGTCLAAFYSPAPLGNGHSPDQSLRAKFDRIRCHGWTFDSVNSNGLNTVAAPVTDIHGGLLGVIAVAGKGEQFDPARIVTVAANIKRCCSEISKRLN